MSQKVKPGSGKGDVSYVRATGPPTPVNMAMPPNRDGSHTPSSQVSGSVDNDWDDRDEIRMRELEEARARATQMEKTMRWWSDCTANWREKWSKVRNERNKAREENRQLRAKLEQLVKECTVMKRHNQELVTENQKLKNGHGHEISSETANILKNENLQESVVDNIEERDNLAKVKEPKIKNSDIRTDIDNMGVELEESLAQDKATLLGLKLDEAQKTIVAERGERSSLTKAFEKLQLEYNALKSKHEDLKHTKHETMFEVNKLKDDHKEEINRLLQEVEDESANRMTLDKRLGEVRRELEKLQRENADEWGKRERLETERFALERDNKKLRTQIEDLEEQLERKTQKTVDSDMRTLQIDLSEKTKELNDLRHTHAKLKKNIQEKLTELDHTKRRAEQYEMEVKKLRGRIEELKRELANAEDEADTQGNMVRKLQRTNEELQEQMENLQVQLNHTQSRLQRSSQTTSVTIKSRTGSLKSFDPDDPINNPDSDEDLDDDFDDET